jgi:excisionase family DNA binding protein
MASIKLAADELIGIPEAAAYLQVTTRTIHKWIYDEKRLPAYRVGPRMIRLKRADVEALLVQI